MSEEKPSDVNKPTDVDLDWETRRYKANILGQISAGSFIAGILAPLIGYLINSETVRSGKSEPSSVISYNTEINIAIAVGICIVLSFALYYAGEYILKGGDK